MQDPNDSGTYYYLDNLLRGRKTSYNRRRVVLDYVSLMDLLLVSPS